MTATTSANKSFFGKRFLTDLAENKKILIINFVLEILGLPIITAVILTMIKISELEEKFPDSNYEDTYLIIIPFLLLGIGTFCISMFLGIVVSLFHFDYLYRKPIVDMHYSLPLNSSQRFIADYFSGLCIYIIPAIISVITSIIIYVSGSSVIENTDLMKAFPVILELAAALIVGMVMLYTISILSIVFCGSTFEAIYSIIAVNVMIPSVIACIWFAVISASSYGMVFENIVSSPLFTSTSPIGAIVFIYIFMFESLPASLNDDKLQYFNSMFIQWIIVAVIMTVVYFAAAFLLNRFRKAESVSKPYVYKAFFYIIFGASVFCIMSLFISNGLSSIPAVIMCAVGWFIMEVITRRGFKKFWTAPLGFIATVIGVYMICGFCDLTNGFGASRRVPPAISVESVTFETEYDSSVLPYDIKDIKFRDKDVIKAVTALNKEAVNRHFSFDDYDYEYFDPAGTSDAYNNSITVRMNYHTYYGTNVARKYEVPTYMLADVASAILTSDEYADYASEQIAYGIINGSGYTPSPNNAYYTDLDSALKSNHSFKCPIFNKLHKISLTTAYSSKEVQEIRKAYAEDLKNMTASDLKESNVYCYISDFWVLDSFENTKEALGIDLAPIDITTLENNSSDYYSSDGFSISKYPTVYFDVKESFEQAQDRKRRPFSIFTGYYEYYDHSDNNRYAKLDTIVHIFPLDRYYGYSSYNNYDTDTTLRINSYLEDLIEVAKPIVIDEKPVAVISCEGYQLYIIDTPENRDLIKKYFKN